METTLAVNAPDRTAIRKAMESINERIASLKLETESPNKTNGLFPWVIGENEDSKKIPIEKINSITYLINIVAFLENRKENYLKAEKILGVTTSKFKYAGYTVEAWTEDVKKRVKILSYQEELKKLEEGKLTLSKYLTEEDKIMQDLRRLHELGIIPKAEVEKPK